MSNHPHIDKMEARLSVLKSDLDRMQAKAAEASADARIKMQDHISELQTKRQSLSEKLKSAKKSAGEATEEMVKGFEASWNELRKACSEASAKFQA